MMRQVYLAATGMNRGKTTFALGLVAALLDRGLATGFMKPVGQRYAVVDGMPADEDAILVRSVFGLPDDAGGDEPGPHPARLHHGLHRGPRDRRPGGTHPGRLRDRVRRTRHRASWRAPATPVSARSSGCPTRTSRRCWARPRSSSRRPASAGPSTRSCSTMRCSRDAAWRSWGPSSTRWMPTPTRACRTSCARASPGTASGCWARCRTGRSCPTRRSRCSWSRCPASCSIPGDDLDRRIEHVAIGAMQPRHVIERIGPGSLLIVPGDREDVVHATIAANRRQRALAARERACSTGCATARGSGGASEDPSRTELAGLVFTGGYRPRPRELEAIRQAGMFAYFVPQDTYRRRLAGPRPAGQDPPGGPGQDRRDPGAGRP